ncbi:hypothetical protein [Mycobacteroides abscessus]|nr:hypothetical protein [Mycobacteroides abscessus]
MSEWFVAPLAQMPLEYGIARNSGSQKSATYPSAAIGIPMAAATAA